MRYVIHGAGAVGGAIAARLQQSGADVLAIARAEHGEAIRARGLRLRTPEGDESIALPCVAHPREIAWRSDDVVLLTTKTQDSESALADVEEHAGDAVPIVCAQNGVENERIAARRFRDVYAMSVNLPATFLEPGVVIAVGTPLTGVLHAGRWPHGIDERIERVCADLSRARFASEPDPLPLRLKYTKLLMNLGNAWQAIAAGTPRERGEAVLAAAREEAHACYAAAKIEWLGPDAYREKVARHYRAGTIDGQARGGGSTWQSVIRGHTRLEVDYLNGEIVRLGVEHGVPTPVNRALRRVANRRAAQRLAPGADGLAELEHEIERQGRVAVSPPTV